ncbi:MAG: Capsule assembly protein Wzi [Gemmatimonadetes bacterium]|nr:Capsule assembly protein Wzi [Gemmatimonadota bacterium]
MRRRSRLLPLFLLAAAGASVGAQCTDSTSHSGAITIVGSAADVRARDAQDLGRCSLRGSLIRSSRSLTTPLNGNRGVRWAFVPPSIDETYNSALPFSLNDGAQWAGKGLTSTISAGLRLETSSLSLSFSPEFVYQQNKVFPVLPATAPGRSTFSSPWHGGIESADIPLRFGNQSIVAVYPGESWIEYHRGALAVGASTDEQWWGPGIRNALVMSNNAAGIPEVYLRTQRPLKTRLGDVEFRWILGGLTESLFFDTISTNNIRSLSAAVVTLRVAFDTGLTVGVARSVYAPVASTTKLRFHALDVLDRWDQTPDTIGAAPAHPTDQIMSFFWRWVFPESGFEFYGEWAKLFPPGLREMLVAPQLHQGFTLGLQWVNPLSVTRAVRLQAEATMLEQTPPSLRATMPSFYVSRFVPQGYTQRGQVIGAAIGPGGSSQFLAGDYLAHRWRAGLELGRIRWEDEAYYRSPNGVGFVAHDVSLFAGLRGGVTVGGTDVDVEAITQKRLNYLFQSAVGGFAQDRAFDVNNLTFKVSVVPR